MTIQIDEPLAGASYDPDGSPVVLTVLPCPICQHRSGTGPCAGCQPAGSGKVCLACRYRGPVPVMPTPIMPGMPGYTGP